MGDAPECFLGFFFLAIIDVFVFQNTISKTQKKEIA